MNYISKKEINFKEPLVITGFPGMGLVGNIAAHYIVSSLNLNYIGYFDSPNLPPVMTVENGIIYPPIRLYGNENLMVIYSEVLIPPMAVSELTDEIVKCVSDLNPKIIVNLDGITALNPKEVYAVSSSAEVLKSIEKENIPSLNLGLIGGMAGVITLKCGDGNIPSICLMAETPGIRPDPKGASNLIEVLNKLYNIGVNTDELIKEDEELKEKLRKLSEEHLKLLAKQKTESPMYM